MADFACRSVKNPILSPMDVKPTRGDWQVECLLNPGAFRYRGRTGLLLRVAERPAQEKGWVSTPYFDAASPDGVAVLRVSESDPKYQDGGPCAFTYDGATYLTTLSHLRLAWSDDGIHFKVDHKPTICGVGAHETFGVEDCRVTQIGQDYYLTYSAVSDNGVGVGLVRTTDWVNFERLGMMLPPHNKDCGLFDRRVGDYYYALHRPSGHGIGGHYMWISRSPDLHHWGDHCCIAKSRPNKWDSARIGAGASPILTDAGWLEIYHAADDQGCYRLGLMLMDLKDPSRLLARSSDPIMEPSEVYEKKGFVNGVVFTNGHVVDGDRLTMYYGGADKVVCTAELSIRQLLATLK